MEIPRPEHPFPQFLRERWLNLNGLWEFESDPGKSGMDRGLFQGTALRGQIMVPFCPESLLSGVGNRDFQEAVWYRRTFRLPADWPDGLTFLHFGAVDYRASVFVNGERAGEHTGGYSSFSFDITGLLTPGENVITVYVQDLQRSGRQPRGKQCGTYASQGCEYTRTTGIWQTVWLEHRPRHHLVSAKFYPDVENRKLDMELRVTGAELLTATAFYEGRVVGRAQARPQGPCLHLSLPLEELHLWEVGIGRLYDLTLEYGKDRVESYFGMRSIRFDGMRFLLNGKSVFQRLVLDQGFYPDGIYTAPTDEALSRDILLSQVMGFNGARLHEKIFEPRFLYHADRLGYLVWGEHANWGLDITGPEALHAFLPEWAEAVTRDFNHPSIIGWCPFNETWDLNGARQLDSNLELVYRMTKLLDPTRPCIDTSGCYHVATDIFDAHDYRQDVAAFAAIAGKDGKNRGIYNEFPERQHYREGQPYFISEFGGILWNEEPGSAWGYGNAPKTKEEFLARFAGLVNTLLDNPNHFGFCYTQLYDVEQERNGLYTYARVPKFDPDIIQDIVARMAAIEN